MKKIISNIALLLFVLFFQSGCDDKTSENVSRVTYYVNLEIEGDGIILLPKGTTYQEPGYTAIENGEDVSDKVVVKSNLNSDKEGKYTINYSATNVDGFAKSVNRTVYVVDSSDPICGVYYSEIVRLRDGATSSRGTYMIQVTKGSAESEYNIDDFLGGWYRDGSSYGDKYAAVGKFTLNSDNTISIVSSSVAGWGDELSGLKDTSFDPQSGILMFTSEYAGMEFTVTATKWK